MASPHSKQPYQPLFDPSKTPMTSGADYGTPKSDMVSADPSDLLKRGQARRTKQRPALQPTKFDLNADLLPILLSLCVCMGSFLFGYHVGFSSPAGTPIENEEDITSDQGDFAFSLLNVGAMFGSLAAGKFADMFGRRMALMLNSLSLSAGAVIIAFWVTYPGLVLGRLVAGFGVGYASVIVPLYIAEISPPHLRGGLGAVNQLFITLGILLVNVIGLPIVHKESFWKVMMLLSLAPVAAMFFPILLAGPETPRWLVRQNRLNDARDSLQRLRGKDSDISNELDELLASPEDSEQAEQQGLKNYLLMLLEPRNSRPMKVGVGVVMLQQWSGVNAFIFNTKQLFQGEHVDPNDDAATLKALHGAIIVGAVQVVMTAVSASLMDRAGRRFFLLLSSTGMCLSCLIMGFVYHANAAQGLKIAIVIIYISFFALGLGPVPWIVCSEIFPFQTRGLLVSLCTVINWLSSFIVTLTFNRMNSSLTNAGTFWFYCGTCFLGAVFVFFFVPETKGKTLKEIESLFSSDQSADISPEINTNRGRVMTNPVEDRYLLDDDDEGSDEEANQEV